MNARNVSTPSTRPPDSARWRPALLLAGSLALLLAGCSAGPAADSPPGGTDSTKATNHSASESPGAATPSSKETGAQSAASTPGTARESDPDAAPAARGLDKVDLANVTWVFRPGANSAETMQIPLQNGTAQVWMANFTLGQVLYADVTGDGIQDAAGQLTRLDGNAVDDQWYLWIAADPEPIQVLLPIARSASCGDAIESVSVVDGGFQVHEFRRSAADAALPCSERGSEERVRTIAAAQARNVGEWWPMQVEPGLGYGGVCPQTLATEAMDHVGDIHVAPDTASREITGGRQVGVFQVDGWPVFGEDFPGWALVGVKDEQGSRCAWAQRP